jgi:methyl-accepting chemotaxis protein
MQRVSKIALSGNDPDEAMQRVEKVLKMVTDGSKEEGIPKYEKKEFRAKLDEVKNKWYEVKALSKKLKEQGKDEQTLQKLFEESEILFKLTDELVGISAEYVRESNYYSNYSSDYFCLIFNFHFIRFYFW